MPSCEDEVLSIGRKLDKIIDGSKSGENAADLLEVLSKLPITIDILTKTRIGMTINDLRKKTSDEKLAKKAKGLIKEWKNLVDKREDKKEKPPRNDPSSSGTPAKNNGSAPSQPPPKPAPTAAPPQAYSSNFPPKHLEKDEMRLKSAQMILNALRHAELPDGTLDPEEIAVRVEEKLFTVHKGTGDKYKAALRSRVFNLRDKKNPALRENVLTGVVKPEKFAVMTSEEMASDEVREMRDKFNKAAILEHQMSVQQGTPSDMFKCGKCGKKNCTYTQLQTRSSDEPMTTFVFCLECGNRWKFC
ncbi:transcription elongation factor S-II [Ancylostoma duodenale]|uniref:Transcription elongation factor n=1 Tax=Ancylostoma duodenale TaxID=51022 RepID=A0A0C2H105_9BILA|nr:transcription elongation factor S-II [Ancylostoma duodenale]